MTVLRNAGFSFILAVLTPLSSLTAERQDSTSPPIAAVDLFDAIQSGDIEARFIPRNSAAGTVLFTNKSAQPLAIRLPEAFAGVPALAQIGQFPGINAGNNQNGGNGRNNAGNQSVGAAFPGSGQGQNGPGIFSVEPGRPRKLKVVSVCLDFGKPDPGPRVPYELVPFASRSRDGKLLELVKMLGSDQTDQHAAQAAAWHLANELSWQELAGKSRKLHIGGKSEPLFTAEELKHAQKLVESAGRLAAKSTVTGSYGGELERVAAVRELKNAAVCFCRQKPNGS